MKFLFRKTVSDWNMTGILSTGARWFLGLSRLPSASHSNYRDTWILKSEHDKVVDKLQLELTSLNTSPTVSAIPTKEEISRLFTTAEATPVPVVLPTYVEGQPYVVCAAARNTYNGAIVCSPRHYDSTFQAIVKLHMETADEQLINGWKEADQGFVDQFGNFLTRAEARKIAVDTKQIRRRCGGDHEELYSENLY